MKGNKICKFTGQAERQYKAQSRLFDADVQAWHKVLNLFKSHLLALGMMLFIQSASMNFDVEFEGQSNHGSKFGLNSVITNTCIIMHKNVHLYEFDS